MLKHSLMDDISGVGVELRQCVGWKQSRKGLQKVRTNTDFVYLDGERIGILARRSDCILCILVDMDVEQREMMHKEVTMLRLALGKWMPRQDGRKISIVPTKANMDAQMAENKEVDKELINMARRMYGLDDEEEGTEAIVESDE